MLLQTGLTAIGLVRSNLSLLLLGINADLLVRLALTLELDDAVNLGVQGIVIADADIVAGMDYSAALANQNVAGEYELTIGALNAQTLRGRVTAVTRATHTFLWANSCRFIIITLYLLFLMMTRIKSGYCSEMLRSPFSAERIRRHASCFAASSS